MSINSTKSRSRKDKFESAIAPYEVRRESVYQTSEAWSTDTPSRMWRVGVLATLILAAGLRCYDLTLRPLHNDEGVNAYFLDRLFHQGIYHYDPANYHGPTLYYCALVTSSVNELFSPKNALTIVGLRLVPALFGIATVGLLLYMRRWIGELGALAAGFVTAISPGAVYVSRDFIHETLFVFFTLATVVEALRYRYTRSTKDLLLASASVSLLVATKETAVISIAVVLIAASSTVVYIRVRTRSSNGPRLSRVLASIGVAMRPSGSPGRQLARLSLALITFVSVYILLYSSFLSDFAGLRRGVETFKYWVRAGTTQQTWPWYSYLQWTAEADLLLLGLGVLGAIVAARGAQNRLAIFSGLWACGSLAAYSLLPYKTPWLALNFLVPLAICGGHAVTVGWDYVKKSGNERAKVVVITLAFPAMVASLYQSIHLNFFAYDDERHPYVYMQTRRETLSLVDQVNNIAKRSGKGDQTTITITSPDYWPLPWYLRNYEFAGYPGGIVSPQETMIIASEPQEHDLIPLLQGSYQRVGSYPLRPGVTLVLYLRNRIP